MFTAEETKELLNLINAKLESQEEQRSQYQYPTLAEMIYFVDRVKHLNSAKDKLCRAPQPKEERLPLHYCYKHSRRFSRRSNSEEEVWYSHKTSEGLWCNLNRQEHPDHPLYAIHMIIKEDANGFRDYLCKKGIEGVRSNQQWLRTTDFNSVTCQNCIAKARRNSGQIERLSEHADTPPIEREGVLAVGEKYQQ